jgi:hypothetical protein
MLEHADPAVKQLTKIAFDETAPIETRVKVTLAIIDRTGLAPRTSIDLEVNPRPLETIFEEMEMDGKRSDYRGEPEVLPAIEDDAQTALVAYDEPDHPLDVDVIDVEPIHPRRAGTPARGRHSQPIRSDTTARSATQPITQTRRYG